MLGKLLGTRECALCDISHGWQPMGKQSWRLATGPVQDIQWLHRNEQPPAMRAFTEGSLPVVIADEEGQFKVIFDRASLAALNGDFAAFEAAFAVAIEGFSSEATHADTRQ